MITVHGKGHNPNYTASAVAKLADYSAELSRLKKRHGCEMSDSDRAAFRARFDWAAMTEQDSAVWDVIFDTLDA